MAFSVMRTSKTLIKPSSDDTPSVTLDLSAIDRIPVLRCNARTLHVFNHGPEAARVIREAMSKVLVPYYPLAGRLTESVPGQLQIQCSGGGVSFIEATSGMTSLAEVDYLEDVNSIPYDELLPDTYNYDDHLDGREPLVQMQQLKKHKEPCGRRSLDKKVTQFACGGFVIGLIFCHSICDGLGAAQFLNALGEVARGLDSPSINPVWSRDFFASPNANSSTPTPLFPLPPPMPDYRLNHANIDIEVDEITSLKNTFHESSTTGQKCSTFDAVAASFWSARTRAIKFDPETELKLVFFANCREIINPPLPKGFYGNCFFPVTITASSDWLEQASFVDVVRRIQEAKLELANEFGKYKESVGQMEGDPFAPPLVYTTLFLSEWGRLGFNQVDYGWGPPVHVVPIQGSAIIPVGIMGSLPLPKKGIRLMTWCVEDTHRQGLVDQMANTFSTY